MINLVQCSSSYSTEVTTSFNERMRIGVSRKLPNAAHILMGLLVISLIVMIMMYRSIEKEKEMWKQRLVYVLKSTSDSARVSESRLQKTMTLLKSEENEEDKAIQRRKNSFTLPVKEEGDDIPQNVTGSTTIILFCYNRPDYLKRTLESLTARIGYAGRFLVAGLRIVISQDGYDASVKDVSLNFIEEMKFRGIKAELVQHSHEIFNEGQFSAYYSLASHYRKGLKMAFSDGSKRVIILEDDLELAVDFFQYFQTLSPLLDSDSSLFCVSAWNDNGQANHVLDPKQLYRSDFFPGLGWMLTSSFWKELEPKWPLAFWDDWLREPKQRKGRQCIRPEVSRTITFGLAGASKGEFFEKFLRSMKLNDQLVQFGKSHVKFLERNTFDEWFMNKVSKAKEIQDTSEINGNDNNTQDYILKYSSIIQFEKRIAPSLGIMEEFKANVPRAGYRGIVPIRHKGKMLFIAPTVIPPLENI